MTFEGRIRKQKAVIATVAAQLAVEQDELLRLQALKAEEDRVRNALTFMDRELARRRLPRILWPRVYRGKFREIFTTALNRFNVKHDRLRGRWKSYFTTNSLGADAGGRPALLSAFEEREIVRWAEYQRVKLNAPNRIRFKAKIVDVLRARGSVRDPCSNAWLTAFMKKKSLVGRAPRSLEQTRCGLRTEQVAYYYYVVSEKEKYEKCVLWLNFDETGFHGYSGSLQGTKVYVGDEHRQLAYCSSSSVRDHVTLLATIGITADGRKTYVFPPLWVFPAKHINTTHLKSTLDPENRTDTCEGFEFLSAPPVE